MDKDLKIKIQINSDTKGLKTAQDGLKDVGNNAITAADKTDTLSARIKEMGHTAVAVYSVSQAFSLLKMTMSEYIKLSDEMLNINSKLNLVTDSYKELAIAQDELFKIAQDSRVGFAETVDLYGRIARSTRGLKLENTELFETVDTISKAMVLSGSTTESMNAAIVQLGQGFASGTLRGEELNSVMEQTPRLAGAIADGMGINIGQLRKYAEEGKITSSVIIKALKGQAKTIDSEFSSMNITVAQSMTTFKNSLLLDIGVIDDVLGLNTKTGEAFRYISTGMAENTIAIRDFTIDTSAYLGKLKDTTYATYLTIENFGQGLVYGLNSTVYGTLKVITYAMAKSAQGLNSVGLSSKESMQTAVSLYNEMVKQEKIANNGLTESLKETNDAYKKASISIADRIELSREEYKLAKLTRELNDKIAKKNAPPLLPPPPPELTKEQLAYKKLNEQWADEKLKLIARENGAIDGGYQKQIEMLTAAKDIELKKFGTVAEAKAQIEATYLAEKKAIETKWQDEEQKKDDKRVEDEIDNANKLAKEEIELKHKIGLESLDIQDKKNALESDSYKRQIANEDLILAKAKEELEYKKSLGLILKEQYDVAISYEDKLYDKKVAQAKASDELLKMTDFEKAFMNSATYKEKLLQSGKYDAEGAEEEDKKRYANLGNAMGQSFSDVFMQTINGGSFSRAFQSSMATGGNQLVGQSMNMMATAGGTALAQSMGVSPGVGMLGVGLAMGAVGALLEKPTETLLSQENFLEELTASNRAILEETKALRVLNKAFGTDTQKSTKSFLTAYGSGYTLNTQIGEDMQTYIENLYKDIANATTIYNIKTGENTVQKSKAGFLGIGAKSWTEIQDVWGTYTGQEVSAMQFLAQFGVDSKGSLTADGLSSLTSAFNAYSELVTKLDEYAPDSTDIEKLTVQLAKIDTNKIKNEMYQTYSSQLAKVGINLAEITIDNIDEAFNDTTLGELIKNDPSLNVNGLTNHIGELNNAYLQQIELTKQLSEAKLKETLKMTSYAKELQDYQTELTELGNSTASSFVSVFDSILNSLRSMKSLAKETIASVGTQDLSHFWELNSEFQGLINANKYEEASSVFSAISQLGKTLSQDDPNLNNNLMEYLDESYNSLDAAQTTVQNEIINGLGKLYNLTETQITAIKNSAFDGVVSGAELEAISKDLDPNTKNALTDMLNQMGLLGADGGVTLQKYAELQLEELRKVTENETNALSVESFKYLDYLGKNEQLGIASKLGKSFADVEEFILGLQSFDVKNSIEDLEQLKAMLDYSFDGITGKVSYSQTAVADLSKLWEYLPADIKAAYSSLGAFATVQQNEYLSGKNTALSVASSAMAKENKEAESASENASNSVKNIMSQISDRNSAYYALAPLGLNIWDFYKYDVEVYDHVLNEARLRAALVGKFEDEFKLPTEQSEAKLATAKYNDLLKLTNSYTQTALPSFAVGSSYIPNDMTANIHRGEMIIDPQSSSFLRKYGISSSINVSADSKELLTAINKLISIQSKLLRVTEDNI